MILLVTQAMPTMRLHEHPHLGRLVQPRHFSLMPDMMSDGLMWAADNDCYQGLDAPAYIGMLDEIQASRIEHADGARERENWRDRCLFVTVPDSVGDPVETARLWGVWAHAVRRRGLPLAFVAQDGCEHGRQIPYLHEFDALFVGGRSDEWKLGLPAERLVRAAKRAGKWVHFGRVNSEKRLRYCAAIGCDSVDGTGWVKWRDATLDWGLGVLHGIDNGKGVQTRLEV